MPREVRIVPAMKASPFLLIAMGVAVIVFGLFLAEGFYIRLPGFRSQRKVHLPHWFSRLWFLCGGALLIYLGVRRYVLP